MLVSSLCSTWPCAAGGDYQVTIRVRSRENGDGWDHEILVEKVLASEDGMRYPQCLAGKQACPPEDCGGTWGYEHFLEVIKDEEDPEHEEMLE